MMDAVRKCSELFKFSAKKQGLLERLIPDGELRTKLLDVCKTRWLQRLDGLERMQQMMEWVLEALEIIKDDMSLKPEQRGDADGLFLKFQSFGFAVTLIIVRHIISYVDPLTTELQKVKLDVIGVYKAVDTCLAAIDSARNVDNIDEKHKTWYEEVKKFANKYGIPESKPRFARKQIHRANYETDDISEYYKWQLTIPFLDRLSSNLCHRFSEEHRIHMNGAQIIPSHVLTTLSWRSHAKAFSEQYADDLPNVNRLDEELDLWEHYWKGEETARNHIPDDVTDTLTYMHKSKIHLWYPNIHTILILIATVPSSSCSCERSISRLRLLKTYLRSTMKNERLNGLALLSIHYDMQIDYEKVLDIFARRFRHRLQLLDILNSD